MNKKVIKEDNLCAGIFGLFVGIFVLAITASGGILYYQLCKKTWFMPLFALILITLSVRPIEKLVYSTIGRFLFRKKYEYQKGLQDAASGMVSIRDPQKLVGLIVHIISRKMKVDNVSVLIYEEGLKGYELKASRGPGKPKDLSIRVKDKDPLIEWLKENEELLVREELEEWVEDKRIKEIKSVLLSDLKQILDRMLLLKADICIPSFYRGELLGILILGNNKAGHAYSQDELTFFSVLANEAAIAIKNSQLYSAIEKNATETEDMYEREHKLFMHASIAFAAAIDARDPHTHGHSERVTNYTEAILNDFDRLPEIEDTTVFKQRMRIAAVLHDIGKIGISDEILHKPGRLNAEERKTIERHPVIGADIVSHIRGLLYIVGAIRHHHERYDGKGYPDGLIGDDIPLMARIIAVADSYDAMVSDRPYRKGLSVDIMKDEIKKNSMQQFDPSVVEAFLKAFEKGEIKAHHA